MLLPDDGPDAQTYARATAKYTPYLYYFLMGKLLHLNIFGLSDLLYLRFISVILGVATVYVGWLLMKHLSHDRLVQVLFLVMMTNTLMINVNQSSVTYDALANFAAALAVLFMARHFSEPSSRHLFAVLICLATGTLTKSAFLPLAFILVVCLLVHERKKLRHVGALVRAKLHSMSASGWTVLAALIVLFVLNAFLYGRNLILFNRLEPRAEQFPIEIVMDSPYAARDHISSAYLRGDANLNEALELAERVDLPAARRDTKNLLHYYDQRRARGEEFEPATRLNYAYNWLWMMTQSTYGVFGHESVLKGRAALMPYMAVFTIAFILFVYRWPRLPQPTAGYLMIVVVFYTLIVMQFVGYASHVRMQGPLTAVQGRYLFPILVPAYALIVTSLVSGWPRYVKIGILAVVGLIFIEGDFHFYLKNAQSDFYFSFLERILFL